MYAQIDGVLMGSPLSLVLANNFVGFYESLLFEKCCTPYVYLHYADDTFSIFDSINDTTAFHTQLISLHPFLQFTIEVGELLYFAFFGCSC